MIDDRSRSRAGSVQETKVLRIPPRRCLKQLPLDGAGTLKFTHYSIFTPWGCIKACLLLATLLPLPQPSRLVRCPSPNSHSMTPPSTAPRLQTQSLSDTSIPLARVLWRH